MKSRNSRITDAQADLAKKAAAGELSHDQAANAVRQRQGKQKPTPRTTKQTFFAENGWKLGNRNGVQKGNVF